MTRSKISSLSLSLSSLLSILFTTFNFLLRFQFQIITMDTKAVQRTEQRFGGKPCSYWLAGRCNRNPCRFLHCVVTGITLPEGLDKLYSGSTDGTVRTWDCHTGQCINVRNCGSEVNSLISEGPWIFVGLHNIVKAWNIQNGLEFTLDGPRGKVLSMVVGNDTLLAGAQDGVISAWRGNSDANSPFKLVASLNGHTKAITCLTVGRVMLFSGSMDHSIKVWDLDTLQCKMTLDGHTDVVTSLICWDSFLLSSSSDCTIKIWVATEEGTIKVTYTHAVDNGILALSGMSNAEGKPILFSSFADNSVRLYELPSFLERGRLFSKNVVRSIETGPGGLFFTGDGTGLLMVWRWLELPKVASS